MGTFSAGSQSTHVNLPGETLVRHGNKAQPSVRHGNKGGDAGILFGPGIEKGRAVISQRGSVTPVDPMPSMDTAPMPSASSAVLDEILAPFRAGANDAIERIGRTGRSTASASGGRHSDSSVVRAAYEADMGPMGGE